MSCCNYYLTEDEAIDIQLGESTTMTTEKKIEKICDEVKSLLISKNRAYGDSATKPLNIFAKGNATENLCARIDDKLARIKNRGINDDTEDTIDDLIGYLILLKISLIKQGDTDAWKLYTKTKADETRY